ncbi:MAG: bifunctional methylenetetrahydrofolate dehydrogenase/methenyltetrahydrofolate cyclohydrolase FolD [Clostridiales bacterium]|nr:bifunctional methylenetetrahydrofolate dehydrogenase/methenyltetrahydrofolate cyclohydrolase FolD [Clostridiales bacterium]
MADIIDGKVVSAQIKEQVKKRAEEFEAKFSRKVGLAVVKAGNNPASEIYVRNKIKACEACNIKSFSYNFDDGVTQNELIELIHKLNKDKNVDGILVQLPLPKGIDEREVLSEISPEKDADGFHAVNAGKLFLGEKTRFVACTPRGIMELIRSTGTSIAGKRAVVVGRSNIVGKPIAMLLLNADATVTVCHSKTKNLGDITREADILVVAIGKKKFITADMVKRGAIVIDVGMNRDEEGLFGDVDFESVKEVAGYITPVPGGVGPMTIAMLLMNTVDGAFDE